MTPFKKAYEKVIRYEGGYANDPNDGGGETYKGIARNFHPNWAGWLIIDDLKKNADSRRIIDESESLLEPYVERFYLENYWRKIRGDALPSLIAEELFEQSVNLGISVSVKHLQTSLNIIAKGDVLAIDGKFGPHTFKMALDLLQGNNIKICYNLLNILQGSRYINLMKENIKYRKYIGWFTRVNIYKEDRGC